MVWGGPAPLTWRMYARRQAQTGPERYQMTHGQNASARVERPL
jgi:hypothetical protein